MRIALFSAFPHELREIVRKIGAPKPVRKNSFALSFAEYSSHEIVIVLTGIGVTNAEKAFQYVLKEHSPDVIVSAGFGGALYKGARIGEIIYASRVLSVTEGTINVIDLKSGAEMFDKISNRLALAEGSVITLDGWKKKAEVLKMTPEGLSRPVCDMETFPLARLSLEKGLAFFSFRAVTDRSDEDVSPELLGVSDESGRYSLALAVKLLLSNPRLIPESIRLGIASYIAGKSLWRTVSALIKAL